MTFKLQLHWTSGLGSISYVTLRIKLPAAGSFRQCSELKNGWGVESTDPRGMWRRPYLLKKYKPGGATGRAKSAEEAF